MSDIRTVSKDMEEKPSVMMKVATFIVDRRNLFFLLFAIAIVFCLIAFYVFAKGYRNGLVVKTLRWIGHIPGLKGWSARFREKHAESLANIDEQIAALHRRTDSCPPC